ncbi:MAG: phage tail tube protein [Bryobacteraceae bacterium]|nr:phage tail tube protein [Bryobacteraceae bacterium]MDW8378085.1 phage tail tube protein [Bryobacterales bacterium]
MPSYISSRNNRVYAAVEGAYGVIPPVGNARRVPILSFAVKSETIVPLRRDKTGTRSQPALASPLRKETTFLLSAYHTSWLPSTNNPSCSALVEASLGDGPKIFSGGVVESIPSPQRVKFVTPHQLGVGQGISYGGELRFVAQLVDEVTVELNCPFSASPTPGSQIGPTTSFLPAAKLPSVSIFDYWSPDSAVQRIVYGAVVEAMKISVNGDFHELEFRGRAADVIDSASFVSGQGGLSSYPVEPAIASYTSQPVPGHLGQAWLGAPAEQFFTVTAAEIVVRNGIEMRNREFGSITPRGFGLGPREVTMKLALYSQDDTATRMLYQAARQRSPIQVMFQLGQQSGQLMGVMLKSVIAEAPQYDDQESRLKWVFSNMTAHGLTEDEICVAFG